MSLKEGQRVVRPAVQGDVAGCKRLADENRDALGFLTRAVFDDAIDKRRLLVAEDREGNVVGFVRYNHRVRGIETCIYDICVSAGSRRQGIGRSLVKELADGCLRTKRTTIVLKCPDRLPANAFYRDLGFERVAIEEGRRRPLNVWRLALTPP